jgi:hypothetical protein
MNNLPLRHERLARKENNMSKPFIHTAMVTVILGTLLIAMPARPVHAASIVVTTAADDDVNNGACSLVLTMAGCWSLPKRADWAAR